MNTATSLAVHIIIVIGESMTGKREETTRGKEEAEDIGIEKRKDKSQTSG